MNDFFGSIGRKYSKENPSSPGELDLKLFNSKSKNSFKETKELILIKRGEVFLGKQNIKLKKIEELFSKLKKDITKKISGEYILVLWEKKSKQLTIISGKLGMMPLYYYSNESFFLFSFGIKNLAESNFMKKKIDWESWADLFSFGYVLGNKTHFKDCFRIPPATILTFKDKKLRLEEYWDYSHIKTKEINSRDILKKGEKAIKDVTKKICQDKKLEILLSGGYDSRCIVSSLNKYCKKNLITLTSSAHPAGKKDIEYAKKVCNLLGIKNKNTPPEKELYKKYFLESLALADYLSFEHIWPLSLIPFLNNNKTNIDGLCGDILLKGPSTINFDKLETKIPDKFLFELIYERLKMKDNVKRFFNKNTMKKIEEEKSLTKEVQNLSSKMYPGTEFTLKNRTRNSVSLIYSKILSKKINTSLFFCQEEILNFALSIKPSKKINGKVYSKLMNFMFPEVMKIPSTRDLSFRKKLLWGVREFKNSIKIRFGINPFKNKDKFIEAKKPEKEDIVFLKNLLNKTKIPQEFINKKRLFSEIEIYEKEGKKVENIIIPLLTFCLWHEKFFKPKP